MSAIEFIAPAAKSFSVQLYNATTGAPIGTAITPVTDGSVPTRYRADTGSNTGTVYVVATTTNLRVSGYANLSDPASSGFSELMSLGEAELVGQDAIAEDIAAINAKIQTGNIVVLSPVNEDGSLNAIVIGDDYLAANGRAFDFFIDPVAGVSVETTSCLFGGESSHRGDWLVTGAVTAVTVDGQPKWRMRSEMDGADTIDCRPGCFDWSATLLSSVGNRITRITGKVDLIKTQTVE